MLASNIQYKYKTGSELSLLLLLSISKSVATGDGCLSVAVIIERRTLILFETICQKVVVVVVVVGDVEKI